MIASFEITNTDPVMVKVTEDNGKIWIQVVPNEHAVSMDAIHDFLEQRYEEMTKIKHDPMEMKDLKSVPITARPSKEHKWDRATNTWIMPEAGVMQ